MLHVVEEAFRQKCQGHAEVPPKPGIHLRKDAFIHAMPAYLSKMNAAGVKWVSGFPENAARGLPCISGLVILNDSSAGFPICIMDCIWLTARRTGAATALAAKYLAREDSKVLGILGCGVQGRSNLEALVEICQNIEEVKAYDINKANEEKYVQEMAGKHELKITSAGSPKRAVQGCDIVVTSGPILKKPEPLIVKSWFRDGGLACPLDFDSYWKTEAMHSMDKFCTDDGEQLAYYRSQGYFADIPSVYADLGEIVTLKKAGRESNRERIMTMNLGLAIEDVATANLIYQKAVKKKIGMKLPL